MFFQKKIKLNLGCGHDIRNGWLNFDQDPVTDDVIKLDLKCQNSVSKLKEYKPDIIELNHVIGYFHYQEGKALIENLYKALNPNGVIIIEYPDAIKVAKQMTKAINFDEYFEAMRAMYAFDVSDLSKEVYDIKGYVFGWTHNLLSDALSQTGYCNIKILLPKTHGKRFQRDTRIEARKK